MGTSQLEVVIHYQKIDDVPFSTNFYLNIDFLYQFDLDFEYIYTELPIANGMPYHDRIYAILVKSDFSDKIRMML